MRESSVLTVTGRSFLVEIEESDGMKQRIPAYIVCGHHIFALVEGRTTFCSVEQNII
jgi:hypothetical protein